MALKSSTLKFLRNELQNQSLKTVWMRLLKTYIVEYSKENNKEDFSCHDDFKSYEKYDVDILKSLSLVDISLFYEYSLAISDSDKRKQSGAYYTPEDIAVFMAEKSHQFEKNKIWLDPCSGIGNLSYHLANVQEDPEQFVLNNLILQDVDELALKIAQVIFSLHFQKDMTNFYDQISNNFRQQDFLEDYDKERYINDHSLISDYSYRDQEPLSYYDYVIVNPPYFAAKQDNRFITSKSRDIYSYFLERIILESKGFISITPQSFINSGNYTDLRNLLIDNINNLSIYAFDNIPDSIFKGYKYGSKNTNTANSVRASIIIGKKDGKSDETQYKITPLLRWRASERKRAIQQFDEQLSVVKLKTNAIFPKLYKGTVDFYYDVAENKRLSNFVEKGPTDYSLIVPSTPRYYITASKTPLKRSSTHILYFQDEETMNKIYLQLNSSYMYWWWRVNDGGMTLSKEVLNSLPALDLDANKPSLQNLVKELEESELVNKTVKMNAGKASENIKHPQELIAKINNLIINDQIVSSALFNTHSNSFLRENNQ